jgi:cytochrome c-type biogenesis protein CcmF
MDSAITRDVWSAIQPDIEAPALQKIISAGNRTLPPQDALVALGVLARSYLQHPPVAQFHFIVSPLVMWIWIGGLIVFIGGAIAVWPAPGVVRARAAARARLPRRLARV